MIPASYSNLVSSFRDVIVANRTTCLQDCTRARKLGPAWQSMLWYSLSLLRQNLSRQGSSSQPFPSRRASFGLLAKGSEAEQKMRGGAEGRTQTA